MLMVSLYWQEICLPPPPPVPHCWVKTGSPPGRLCYEASPYLAKIFEGQVMQIFIKIHYTILLYSFSLHSQLKIITNFVFLHSLHNLH